MERKMTIKRGMTRVKTIKNQLADITQKIAMYGAVSSLDKTPLVDTKVPLVKNHELARTEVESLFQQFNDLRAELVKIKTAIDKVNLVTPLTFQVGDKTHTMSINEALIVKRHVEDYIRMLVNSYNRSVAYAENKVERNNDKYAKADLTEDQKKVLLAEVVYFVSPEQIKSLDEFLVEFVTELDGALDEVNAVTELVIE